MTNKNALYLNERCQDMEKYGVASFGCAMMLTSVAWQEAEFCLLERVSRFLGTKFNSTMTLQELCKEFGVLDWSKIKPELLQQ